MPGRVDVLEAGAERDRPLICLHGFPDTPHGFEHQFEALRDAARDIGVAAPKQILFGDLHVHSTFSLDAFMMALPSGGGEGAHPVNDACDFARHCAGLDFWSINDHALAIPERAWGETIESIRACNAVASAPDDPDTVAFLGWEWTQIGATPAQVAVAWVRQQPGLIIPLIASATATFLFRQFFLSVPEELCEAAKMDGAGEYTIFGRIMLPLVRPALATVAVFQFVPLWNDFFFPLVLLRSQEKWTLPVGMTRFFGEFQTDWSTLFAGIIITTLPLIVVFLLATRQIIAGLTAGIGKL